MADNREMSLGRARGRGRGERPPRVGENPEPGPGPSGIQGQRRVQGEGIPSQQRPSSRQPLPPSSPGSSRPHQAWSRNPEPLWQEVPRKKVVVTAAVLSAVSAAPATIAIPTASYTAALQAGPAAGSVPTAPYTRAVPTAPYTRAVPTAPYTRAVPTTPYTRAVPTAPHTGVVPTTPYTRAIPPAPYTLASPAAPAARTVPPAPYTLASPAARTVPPAPYASAVPAASATRAVPSYAAAAAQATRAVPTASYTSPSLGAPATRAAPATSYTPRAPATYSSATAGSASASSGSVPARYGMERVTEGDVEQTRTAFKRLQIFAVGRRGALSGINPEKVIRQAGIEKKGRIGAPLQVQTNLFYFKTKKKDAFYHYNIKFDPAPGSTRFCRRLIRKVEEQAGISNNYVTDGSSLFSNVELDEGRLKMLVAPTATTEYKITLTYVGCVQATSHVVIQLLNIIFNSILQDQFGMKWMGGNYYDTKNPIQIAGTCYSLYPGFFSSILEYENGTRLMIDISHKLISTETVLEAIQNERDMTAIRSKIVGKIVHTRYNDRTYKVEDLHFDKSPMYTFNFRKNDITVLQYYKLKYNIDIRNKDQPLLAIRSKKKKVPTATLR